MKRTLATLVTISALLSSPAFANEFAGQLTDLANGKITAIAQNADLVAAVIAQNATTTGYDQAKIDALDLQWRAEVDASSKPLIDATLGNAASTYLLEMLEASEGLFSEIFAMDAKGLNVGQSGVTSDYWQGDEGKWQNSYATGAGSIDLGEVEEDESSQTFQSQVSIPILDEAGNPVGAITFGVNVALL